MQATLLRVNRDYRLLFSASAVSNLADGISMVAIPWLATLLTGDPLLISMIAVAQRMPWLLFALPVGVWTDRSDRRLLMVRADLVRLALMVCAIAMISAATVLPRPADAGMTVIFSLAVVAFLLGCAEVVRDNAAQTILPSLVAPSDLEHANGQMWSAEQVTGQFIGPPLAGLLIAAGIAFPFGLDAGFYAVSALLIWLIVLPPRKPSGTFSFWPALREGLGWMRHNRMILRLALMLGVINAVFIGGMTILVLYAQEVLQLSAAAYGLLLTCGAAGGVLGGLASPWLARRLGARKSLVLALCTFALFNLALGLSGSVPLVALGLFFEAAAGMLWNVVTVSYRQRLIPDGLLGRVNSVYRFFGWGAMSFGALAAGLLVTLAEPTLGRIAALHLPYLIGASVCAVLAIYGFFRLRF
ncbi:MFS transporter [Agrobacterium tumefaciens]|uniref:MFS transporter n=1 Tax=Agrobacterium tumefaciens TaxID=358 RepID=UPI00157498B9|nr:MFS transporter [Agrobacterium tumefaciens]NTE53686.1 MFS transporter [Agrobacterium tumefaciens]NTE69208.1 MFS transporter [Agrobacterium tumefaciens]NTE69889.1 MFS transporter [Agrobacterium tumefaciens]